MCRHFIKRQCSHQSPLLGVCVHLQQKKKMVRKTICAHARACVCIFSLYVHHRVTSGRTCHRTYFCHFCHLACFPPPFSPLPTPSLWLLITTWTGAVASKKTWRQLSIFICKKRKKFYYETSLYKTGLYMGFFFCKFVIKQ